MESFKQKLKITTPVLYDECFCMIHVFSHNITSIGLYHIFSSNGLRHVITNSRSSSTRSWV